MPTTSQRADGTQRPWPHLTSADGHPNCYHCSWVWLEPAGRMVIKFLNAACPVRDHRWPEM